MSALEQYGSRYRFIRFVRREGVLQMTIHCNGDSARWSAFPGGLHGELADAFLDVGQDPENRVVILTGAGDVFCTEFDNSEPQETDMARFWNRIFAEGMGLINNLLDIGVPVIGAVNGPAYIHAEIATMSDLVLASDRASFADKAHFVNGIVPGDGVHVWWPMVLGPNRGRQFLLTGEVIEAAEAKALGFVAEVTPHDRVIARAWEIAGAMAAMSAQTLRATRAIFTQPIKRRMLDELGYGLQLEGSAIDAQRFRAG